MKLAIVASVFSVGFLAVPALAADRPYTPPPAAPPLVIERPFDWQGFYLGIHGGGGWGPSESVFQGGGDSPADFDLRGPFVGGQVGINWLLGSSFLVGAEADVSWSGIDGSRYAPGPDITTIQDVDWLGTVRGRAGFVNGNVLLYATGGWAWAKGSRFSSSVGETVSATHTGWTAGGGAEWAIAPEWTLKAEYKYINLKRGNYDFSSNASAVDINLHPVVVGLNRQF
jgi:outer membrane immunogenic protein